MSGKVAKKEPLGAWGNGTGFFPERRQGRMYMNRHTKSLWALLLLIMCRYTIDVGLASFPRTGRSRCMMRARNVSVIHSMFNPCLVSLMSSCDVEHMMPTMSSTTLGTLVWCVRMSSYDVERRLPGHYYQFND